MKDTDDINVKVLEEREKSYLLEDGHQRRAYFPKNQVSFKRRNVKTGDAVATIPEWLLKDRGWT